MHNPRKMLEMMVNDLVSKNKINKHKNNSIQKIFDDIKEPSSPTRDNIMEFKDNIKISRDQYYRYIRGESNSNIKKGSLDYIYKYFEINHPDIYNKYIANAFKESILEIKPCKQSYGCTICLKTSSHLLYLSNVNDKSKIGVSPTKSDDFPVGIYLCSNCFKNKKHLLNASYSTLIRVISYHVKLPEILNQLGVSASTINRIKNNKTNIIDKLTCEKIYELLRFIEEKDRPMQMAIDFILGKITATEISEALSIYVNIEESVMELLNKEIENRLWLQEYERKIDFYQIEHEVGQPSLINVAMDCSEESLSATFSMKLNASWDYLHVITHDSGGSVHSFIFEIQVDDRMDLGGIKRIIQDGKII